MEIELKNLRIINHGYAFFSILIWGVTFISTKYLLNSFSPLDILLFRYAIAYVALWAISPRPLLWQGWKKEAYLFAASVSGASLYQFLENLSVGYTSPASVSFITALAPVATAVVAHFALGEPLYKSLFVGMGISLVGVFFISFGDAGSFETGLLGDTIVLGSTLLWAVYSVIIKRVAAFEINEYQVTRRIFLYTLLTLIPFAVPDIKNLDLSAAVQPLNALNLLFLGVFASALCFRTWNHSVDTLGATTTSKYLFVMPVITLVAQVIYEKSGVGLYAGVGMVLILAGLFVSNLKKEK